MADLNATQAIAQPSAEQLLDLLLKSSPSQITHCYICNKELCSPVWVNTGEMRERAHKLRCDHVFGQACLVKWLEQSARNGCPLCRDPIILGDLLPEEAEGESNEDSDEEEEETEEETQRWRDALSNWRPEAAPLPMDPREMAPWADEAETTLHGFWDDMIDWLNRSDSPRDWLHGRWPVVLFVLNAPTFVLFCNSTLWHRHCVPEFTQVSPVNFPRLLRFVDLQRGARYQLRNAHAGTHQRLREMHERVVESRNALLRVVLAGERLEQDDLADRRERDADA